MKPLIEIVETAHQKCSSLVFENWDDFLGVFICCVGYNLQKQAKRIFDPDFTDDPDMLFVDFAANLLDMSRSDVRKLLKNNGVKVNNQLPSQSMKVKDLPWIDLGEWKVCVVKCGKNKFDFILI